jgi:hypothetical protein
VLEVADVRAALHFAVQAGERSGAS